jgi:hypothetical protein
MFLLWTWLFPAIISTLSSLEPVAHSRERERMDIMQRKKTKRDIIYRATAAAACITLDAQIQRCLWLSLSCSFLQFQSLTPHASHSCDSVPCLPWIINIVLHFAIMYHQSHPVKVVLEQSRGFLEKCKVCHCYMYCTMHIM